MDQHERSPRGGSLFDGKIVGLVHMPQARREQLLVIEAQALLALAGDQVQAEPQARQRAAFALQRREFIAAERKRGTL